MAIIYKSVFLGAVLTSLARAAPNVVGSQAQFLQPSGPHAKPKQTIQQFQVAVVLPPGSKPQPGNQPPAAPSSEYVWLQIPASYFSSTQAPPYRPGPPNVSQPEPDTFKPIRPIYGPSNPPVVQEAPGGSPPYVPPPVTSPPAVTTPPYRPGPPNVAQPEPDTFKPIRPVYGPLNPPVVQGAPGNPPPVTSPPYVPAGTTPPHVPAVTSPPYVTGQTYVPPVQPPATQGTPVDVLLRKCQKPRGQFESDICNKYVNCWDGNAVEQFCPEGLLFHPKGYCDYAYNVDCRGRPIHAIPPPPTPVDTTVVPPGQVPSSSQAPTTAAPPTVIVSLPTTDPSLRKKCLKPRGQFRSKECHKYVNCWDEVVIEQECPKGLLFSNKGYCDYPGNVDCQNTTAPPRSAVPSTSECPIEFGTFRNREKCNSYYTCIGGQVVARYDCPEGFNFNDNLGVCDYADRVDCSKEPQIYYPKANLLSNVQPDFMRKINDCKPGSVFALNPQCTTACVCHESGSEIVQCPSGLAYDSPTDKCILPHLAKC